MSTPKKVIVSGASGQDGSYMIEYLLKHTDNTVIAALRRTSQAILSNLQGVLDNPRVKLVTVDLCDGAAVRSLIQQERPDYFINLGAQTFVSDSWTHPVAHMNTNAISLIYILEAIREYVPACRFYSAGSSEQYGDVHYSPQDEKHPMSPRSIYGVSKCAASHITKVYRESYGLYAVHGVLFNHESPRRQSYFVTRKITMGVARCAANPYQEHPLELGNLDAQRDWSHARDFVEGIWLMLNQEKPREYVLASGETHSVREFVELAFNAAGIGGHWIKGKTPESEMYALPGRQSGDIHMSPTPIVVINPAFYRPAEVALLHGDPSRARAELGWSPRTSFPELVREMVEHDLALVGITPAAVCCGASCGCY